MQGLIVSYRRGRHTQNNNQMIIKVDGVMKKIDAEKLINKKVTWKSKTGKELIGKIVNAHGNKGAVKAYFEIGLPGQSIGERVKID